MNNMNGAGQPAGQRGLLNRAVVLASSNLVLFAILTVVNMVLITANADISFSFSAEIPPILLVYGVSALKETGSAAIASVFFVLAVVSVGFIFLCAVLSKKKPGWLIAALVYTVIDLLLALAVYAPYVVAGEMSLMAIVIPLAFHIWMLYYIIKGISAASKLKKLPPEPMMYDVPFTAAERQDGQASPVSAPADAGNADNSEAPADNGNAENGENREQ